MKRPVARVLLAAANDNGPHGLAAVSSFPPEFFALAGRVLSGRDAWRRAGLSGRGMRVMQALGYLSPADLPSPAVLHGDPAMPRLLDRAAAVPGCGPLTLATLESWLGRAW